jgi:hypothetical protein
MRARVRLVVALAITSAMIAGVLFSANARTGAKAPRIKNKVFAAAVKAEQGKARWPWLQHLSSGTTYALLQGAGVLDARAEAAAHKKGAAPALPPTNNTQGCQNTFVSGLISNVRVNQDCSRRRQAEETIVANPLNPLNLIGGQNDSRVGFNHCGYDWTFNHGTNWGDQIPPFYQFIQGDGHTVDACSDPTATFDASGNAYAGGVLFDVTSVDSTIIVEKSNAGIGGAFYHSPCAACLGPFQTYADNPPGIVATHDDPCVADDKELMVADAHSASPKANNVYMTWTIFRAGAAVGCSSTGIPGSFDSPIFFSQSTTGGATWSSPVEISGSNGAICTANSAEADASACDQDQGSFPIVGPDGTIYVAWSNANVPSGGLPPFGDGSEQVLFVKCPPGNACTSASDWSAPVKVDSSTENMPFGPGGTAGCPGGRTCLPPNGYRVPGDETYISMSIDNAGNLYLVHSDFRNGPTATCPGDVPVTSSMHDCNMDVFYLTSTAASGGSAWSAAHNLTPSSSFGTTAQWQPGSQVTANGAFLDVAYYDRRYGACETTGCNDITWARVPNPLAFSLGSVQYTRITTGSMPNLVPANNPIQAGFLGDYMWLSHDNNGGLNAGNPIIVWADTRGLNGAVEEDVYYSTPPLHTGH